MVEPVLDVQDLSVEYEAGAGTFHALTGVSVRLDPGRVVGIVGETGSGKSTLAHAIPRLLPEPPARIVSGKISFRGVDVLDVRKLRDAGESPTLFPAPEPHDYSKGMVVKSGEALLHPIATKLPGRRRRARREALMQDVLDYLRLVRINDPETILDLYPHELSGGMRQRIMIAMALSAKPSLLIADEPTSALDITIQAQVLTLMKELMDEVQTSILFISHDLGIIAEMADEVGVLYAGHLVEFGPVEEVFANPRHPYTKLLLRSVPAQYKDDGPLPALSGSVPSLANVPPGCPFHPRCPLMRDACKTNPGPLLEPVKGISARTHLSACYYSDEVARMA